MTVAALLHGAPLALRDEDVIAAGGEATVYAAGDRAIKIWHQPSAARAAKVSALLARRATLPDAVVAPEAPVHDAAGRVVGFAMARLTGTWEPVACLGRPTWRQARGVSLAAVAPVVVALFDAVQALHRAGVIVGDLSDQNVLVAPGEPRPVRLVDADSVQIDDLPCEVATEAFLDPRLYGPDLAAPCATAGGAPRTFDESSDRYALLALLFRLLTLVHPYGGSLDALPTLPRRAAARASALRAEVTLPARAREAIEILPRDLRAIFAATFEGGERPSLPRQEVMRWAASLLACGCGLAIPAEHLPCPRCSSAARRTLGSRARGALAATVVLEARGPVVAVAADGDVVVAVALERGGPVLHVVRSGASTRHPIAADPAAAGWDVALSPALVAVAARSAEGVATVHLLALRRGGPSRATTSCERAGCAAAVAVAADVVFRVVRGTLLAGRVEGEALVERAVTTVMTRQTRLVGVEVAGAPAVVALGRALGAPRWALVTRAGAVALDAPPLAGGESVLEVDATGDGDGVVVLARTRVAGRELVRVTRFDGRGARGVDRAIAAEQREAGGAVTALAQRGRLVIATDGGLVREEVAGGASSRFAATEPFVERGAAMAAAPGGVLVAQGRVVRLLRAS